MPLLLHEGFEYVLTERFCQDVLEEYFGYHGECQDELITPSLKEFRYNANAIAIQGQLAPIIQGNVVGQHHWGHRQMHADITNEPLHARNANRKRRQFDDEHDK